MNYLSTCFTSQRSPSDLSPLIMMLGSPVSLLQVVDDDDDDDCPPAVPYRRPVRPMLLDSDSDSGSDYEVVASPAFPYHPHDGHAHVFEAVPSSSCSRHSHLPTTLDHHHHHHPGHHHAHLNYSHSAAAHAQHNAELQSALFGAYDDGEQPPLQPQPAAARVASPKPQLSSKLTPAAKLLYAELQQEQAAAAVKLQLETGKPPGETSLADRMLAIPAQMQKELFAQLDATAPGADFQNALVRTFLADETIVQRLAAGDTVSLNTKTGETSAGVYLPVGGVVDQVNRKVKGSLAAMRKLKKETAAARAEAHLTAVDEGRLRAIEDEAVNAIRETFMASQTENCKANV